MYSLLTKSYNAYRDNRKSDDQNNLQKNWNIAKKNIERCAKATKYIAYKKQIYLIGAKRKKKKKKKKKYKS